MSLLKITQSAPSMHYQDLGRFGSTHIGLSQGGPIDLHAFCWANHLLGNTFHSPQSTTLEISYGNATFVALEDSVIALAGAEMNVKIDNHPAHNWGTHILRKGQTLRLSYASRGLHAYLAIQHGFDAPETLGSSSTVERNSIGTKLQPDTLIRANKPNTLTHFKSKRTPPHYLPDYTSTRKIRVILPQHQAREISSQLLNTEFTISSHSDRMGINLIADPDTDSPLPALPGITSEGIGLGTIQLPPSGNPIVLLNDRQTQGGYAKVGTIARADLPLLTQSRPGAKIKLQPISLQQAADEWSEFVRYFGI